jgi:hypothetical protein
MHIPKPPRSSDEITVSSFNGEVSAVLTCLDDRLGHYEAELEKLNTDHYKNFFKLGDKLEKRVKFDDYKGMGSRVGTLEDNTLRSTSWVKGLGWAGATIMALVIYVWVGMESVVGDNQKFVLKIEDKQEKLEILYDKRLDLISSELIELRKDLMRTGKTEEDPY